MRLGGHATGPERPWSGIRLRISDNEGRSPEGAEGFPLPVGHGTGLLTDGLLTSDGDLPCWDGLDRSMLPPGKLARGVERPPEPLGREGPTGRCGPILEVEGSAGPLTRERVGGDSVLDGLGCDRLGTESVRDGLGCDRLGAESVRDGLGCDRLEGEWDLDGLGREWLGAERDFDELERDGELLDLSPDDGGLATVGVVAAKSPLTSTPRATLRSALAII